MHQTTVRFGHELWQELTEAADECGVSAAQYVRQAAVEHLAAAGRWRHTPPPGAALAAVRARVEGTLEGAAALGAASELSVGRARRLRVDAEAARSRTRVAPPIVRCAGCGGDFMPDEPAWNERADGTIRGLKAAAYGSRPPPTLWHTRCFTSQRLR